MLQVGPGRPISDDKKMEVVSGAAVGHHIDNPIEAMPRPHEAGEAEHNAVRERELVADFATVNFWRETTGIHPVRNHMDSVFSDASAWTKVCQYVADR